MVTTTTSPAVAASAAVAARAPGPSSATRSARVSGPRLLLITTSCPAARARRATVLPMLPLPMNPHVVMAVTTAQLVRRFLDGTQGSGAMASEDTPSTAATAATTTVPTEREVLVEYLDHFRGVFERKC